MLKEHWLTKELLALHIFSAADSINLWECCPSLFLGTFLFYYLSNKITLQIEGRSNLNLLTYNVTMTDHDILLQMGNLKV